MRALRSITLVLLAMTTFAGCQKNQHGPGSGDAAVEEFSGGKIDRSETRRPSIDSAQVPSPTGHSNSGASSTAIATANSVSEGPGSGNGGKGVLINGKLYVLDLIEGGVEENPYFDESIQPNPRIFDRISRLFPAEKGYPTRMIAHKLTEIFHASAKHGYHVLKTMEMFNWRFVKLSPTPVNDQREGVEVESHQYVQLAKRLQQSIIIDEKMWKRLDEKHRTALVFHEVFYAIAQPKRTSTGYMVQNVGAVQELNASLFTEGFIKNLFTSRLFDLAQEVFGADASSDIFRYIVETEGKRWYTSGGELRIVWTKENDGMGSEKLWEIPERRIWSTSLSHLFAAEKQFEFVRQEAVEKICQSERGEKFTIGILTFVPMVDFAIDSYEGPGGQVYSYVKHTESKNDFFSLGSQELTKEFCREDATKAIELARSMIKSEYKATFTKANEE